MFKIIRLKADKADTNTISITHNCFHFHNINFCKTFFANLYVFSGSFVLKRTAFHAGSFSKSCWEFLLTQRVTVYIQLEILVLVTNSINLKKFAFPTLFPANERGEGDVFSLRSGSFETHKIHIAVSIYYVTDSTELAGRWERGILH